jgi:hypothetical protein
MMIIGLLRGLPSKEEREAAEGGALALSPTSDFAK